MSRDLIIHIGLAKTGSTSIQRMLYALRQTLHRRGYYIPAAGCPSGTCCHNNIAHSLSRVPDYRPHLGGWDEFAMEIRTCASQAILVSAEGFTTDRDSGIVDRLAQLAESEDLRTRILAYVRPQYEFLESGYSDLVARGMGTVTFDEFVDSMRRGGNLDFSSRLEPWRDVFGAGVSVFPLEKSRMPNGLLSHFLGQLGVDTRDDALGALFPRERVRHGAKELEVRRLANLCMSGLGFREKRQRGMRLKFLPALLSGDAPFVGMDDTEVQDLLDSYSESNARLARDFVTDDTGALFRDLPDDHARRPNRAVWNDLSNREKSLVRRYLRSVAGIHVGVCTTQRRSVRAEPGAIEAGPAVWETLPQAAQRHFAIAEEGDAAIVGHCDPLPAQSSMKKWWLRPRVLRLKLKSVVEPIRRYVLTRRMSRNLRFGATR